MSPRNVSKKVRDFLAWVETSKRGSRFMYHTGYLADERLRLYQGTWVPYPSVDQMGLLAWRLYEEGKVSLVQQRVGEMDYNYFAERR